MSVFHPAISVVIPVYNHFEHLRKTIVSLQVQSYRPEEIIVVDDGSTENPGEDLLRFLYQAEVKYIHVPHKGAPSARNAGLREAVGEYVFFCDADVHAKPALFAELIDPLISHEDLSFSYCDFLFGTHIMRAEPFDISSLYRRNYISSMALVRKSDALFWDESLTKFQDWDYWLSLAFQGKKGYYVRGILFSISVRGEKGMSVWVPRWGYWWPWRLLPRFRSVVNLYKKEEKRIREKWRDKKNALS